MTNNYCQKHSKKAYEKYQNLFSFSKRPEKDIKILLKKKRKKRQYHRERNKNLSEEQKKRLTEYRRNYCIMHNK